jgi:hypothetical protein
LPDVWCDVALPRALLTDAVEIVARDTEQCFPWMLWRDQRIGFRRDHVGRL